LLLLRPLKGRIWPVGIVAFLYAAGDEYHQTFVPGRGGKWTDVAIDSIGITLVCVVAWLIRVNHSNSLDREPNCVVHDRAPNHP
jgi:VanZ family protein